MESLLLNVRSLAWALALVTLCCPGISIAGAPLKYAPPADGDDRALFTIFVPEGWTMSPQGPRGPKAYGFSFAPEGKPFPYVIVRVTECGVADCEARRVEAEALPSRTLLSGGEVGTSYFDSSRDLAWEKSRVTGSVFVSATMFGQRMATLRFVNDASNVDEFERIVFRSIEYFRIHGPDDEMQAIISGVPAESHEVDPNLFTASGTGANWITSPLVWVTFLGLSGLFYVTRRLQSREEAEQIEKVEEAKRQRRLKEHASMHVPTAQSSQQVRDWAKQVRQRRQR